MLKVAILAAVLATPPCMQDIQHPGWKSEQTESGSIRTYSDIMGSIGEAQIPLRVELLCGRDNIIFHIIIPNAFRFKYFDLNDWNIDYSGKTNLNAKAIMITTCGQKQKFDAYGVYFQDEFNGNNDSFGFSFLVSKEKDSEFKELLRKSVLGCDDWIIDIRHKQQTLKMRIPLSPTRACIKAFFVEGPSK